MHAADRRVIAGVFVSLGIRDIACGGTGQRAL